LTINQLAGGDPKVCTRVTVNGQLIRLINMAISKKRQAITNVLAQRKALNLKSTSSPVRPCCLSAIFPT
jgi:hypothetical protein